VSLELDDLGPEVLAFLTERHLATLTTLRTDGSPHVVPVGFSYEPATRLARVKRVVLIIAVSKLFGSFRDRSQAAKLSPA
jgi:hypothetical protein